MSNGLDALGPLAARVPDQLRASAGYHVPRPANIRAKLDANELPFPLPEELRQRLGAALAEVSLERYPDPNAAELRSVLAQRLGIAPSQLVFGNGSDELIAMIVAAFAAPRGAGQTSAEQAPERGIGPARAELARPAAVLFPSPTFVYYRLAAIARGIESIEVPLTSRFELDEVAIERAIEQHEPSVVFLALPNNPTGTLWRMEFAVELAARHRNVAVISDEAYFAYSGRSSLAHLAQHPNLIVMRTLSKVGMAGLRVGYTISSPPIAELLERLRPPYNLSALDQAAAVFMLREATSWCEASAAEVVTERKQLEATLARLPGVEVFPSEANLLLVRLGLGRATAIYRALQADGLLVRNFDRPDAKLAGPLDGCLRITVGTPAENALLLASLAVHCEAIRNP
ncbi:MAG: histidinol phosphate aminotransferase apoenzyme [Myxococcales bacterium]|nr:histidinol phosphate aminotransferase apoenzyme [Myxococcales bacterium]